MLYEIIYHSEASSSFKEEQLLDILKAARNNNKHNKISGCLFFYNNEFLQILEGERDDVVKTFNRVKQDKRHKAVSVLYEGETKTRRYPYWTMAFQGVSESTQGKDGLISVAEFTQITNFGRNESKSKEIIWNISQQMLNRFSMK